MRKKRIAIILIFTFIVILIGVLIAINVWVINKNKTESPHDHTFSSDWSFDGDAHWHAATCGHNERSESAQHVWDDGVVVAEATKTDRGVQIFTCTVCGYERMETISPTEHEHTYSDEWTSDANYHWHSATCEHRYEINEKGAHEWDNGVVIVPATTTLEGEMLYKCIICERGKTERIDRLSEAHKHEFVLQNLDEKYMKQEATCITPAIYYYSCACGGMGTDIFEYGEALGHNFLNYFFNHDATCSADGTKTAKCERCNETDTVQDEGSKLAHTFTRQSMDPMYLKSEADCEDPSIYYYSCTVCGAIGIETFEYGEALGHVFDDGVIIAEGTETAEEKKEYTCIVCSKKIVVETGFKGHIHTFSEEWGSDALSHWHMAACGHFLETKDRDEHNWDEGVITTQPTVGGEGVMKYTCSDCGRTKEEILPALKGFKVQFLDYDGSVLSEQTVLPGEDAETPIQPYREGYRFDKWNKDFTNVQTDLVIVAFYVKIYEVRFIDYDGSIYDLQIVDSGEEAIRPEADPARVNYRFVGWDNPFSNITENLIVNAVYVRQYGVTFVDHDGTVLLERQLVDVNGAAISPAENPKRTGFTFAGWDTSYTNITAETVVTATYDINYYTVEFVTGGVVISTQNIKYGFNATEPSDFDQIWFDWSKMTGYQFTGWSTAFDEIFEDTLITAIYDEEISVPVLAVESVVVKSGSTSTVEINMYLCSSEPIYGLRLALWYAQRLTLTERNVSVHNPYNGVNSYSLNVNSSDNVFSFIWSNGNGAMPDRYAAVLTLMFEIDRRIPEGEYPIQLFDDAYYISGDLVKLIPVFFNGKIIVTQ